MQLEHDQEQQLVSERAGDDTVASWVFLEPRRESRSPLQRKSAACVRPVGGTVMCLPTVCITKYI